MVYRDAEEALRQRRSELLALRRAQALCLPPAVVAVYARRQARRYAGAGIMALATLMVFDALRGADGLTFLLQLSWPVVFLIYSFTRAAAGQHLRARLYRAAHPTGNVLADVDRLGAWSPLEQAMAEVRALESQSVAPALAGMALLVPLSLHFLAASAFWSDRIGVREFDGWIRNVMIYGGHCHLVLAALGWRFGQRLPGVVAVRETAEVAGWHAWAVTILTSLAAAVVFALLAPVTGFGLAVGGPAVVAATGLVFVPAGFAAMGRIVARERHLLTRLKYSQFDKCMESRA